MRRIITSIALLILMARHRRIVRQILERLFDFVVLQFDTPLNAKKPEPLIFQKIRPYQFNILLSIQITCSSTHPRTWQKRRIVDPTKPTIRRCFPFLIFISSDRFCCPKFATCAQHSSHSGSYPLRFLKTAFVINGKTKKFPSLLSPESLDDTAFGAVSSKLAGYSGGE